MKSKIKRLLALVLCLTMVLNGNVSLLASDEAAAEDQVVAEVAEEMTEEVAEEATEEVTEEISEESVVEEVSDSEIVDEVVEEEEVTSELLTYTWKNDGVTVEVKEKVVGAIPTGSELSVNPIVSGNEYEEVEAQLQEKAENEEYEIAGFLAYDICFVDANGNEIEPNDNVNVSISFDEAVVPEMEVSEDAELDVTVMHFEEDANGEVTGIVDMEAEISSEATAVEKVEFVTDSFSVYTVTWRDSSFGMGGYPGGSNSSSVTVTFECGYIDENDNFVGIGSNSTGSVSGTSDKSIASEFAKTITGYEYSYAYVMDGAERKTITTLRKDDDSVSYNDGNSWTDLAGETIYLVYKEPSPLTTVETVDHTSAGITMTLKNYNNSNFDQTNFMSLGGGWNNGHITQGLVGNQLGIDGYPVNRYNQSIADAFEGGQQVNYLFTKEHYEETGYYEYSSFENYAYLNADGNFTVYDQIGSPQSSLSSTTDRVLYQRGHFYPYNNITAGDILSGQRNLYDEDGNQLAATHPRYNEPLYRIANPDYYFGMYMEASFVQPRDGMVEWKDTLTPMEYSFNGDDDLWIFIDDVLVLDLGGIHVAHRGYIDFSTGAVAWDNSNNGATPTVQTYIKDIYQGLGVFPDGTKWDDERVDEYFKGNTFADYSKHTIKMFYMERGAGGSDIHVKFNLPIIPEGSFDVTKELSNTDKEKYANVEFAFQVYAQKILSVDEDGVQTFSPTEYELITSAVYKEGNEISSDAITFYDDQEFNGQSYDGVFYLKPGETAHFSGMEEDRKYYVVEVGVNAQEYDQVVINNTGYTEFDDHHVQLGTINNVQTEPTEIYKRAMVVFTNRCSAYNNRELRITKQMVNGQTSNDSFTFKVMLEDVSGQLVPYVGPYYLQDAQGGYYTYVDGVLRGPYTDAVVCGNTTSEGYISDVKVGYTASITGILSETEFAVSEVNIDEQYNQNPSKVVSECDATTMQGADGQIALGKDAIVVITNSYKKAEDVSYIEVSKIFEGIDPAELNDFVINVQNKTDETIQATLTLEEAKTTVVDGKTTYTWVLEGYPAGTYVVSENNYNISNYQTTTTINGVPSESGSAEITISAADWNIETLVTIPNCNVTEHPVSGANLIVAKLTENAGCFVWTTESLSVQERLAVVEYIKSSGLDANSTLEKCYFYSGDISDTLVFRGDEISYDGSTLRFTATSQWSQFIVAEYENNNTLADISFVNTYVENTADLDLFKTTVNGIYVDGAEFKLSKLEGDIWKIQNASILVDNETGKVELVGLHAGIYMLEEMKAPTGCRVLEDKIYFKVELGTITLCDEDGNALTSAPTMWELTETGLTIKNDIVYELPQSGGFGIFTYMIGGTMLMAVATLILYKERRKEVLAK